MHGQAEHKIPPAANRQQRHQIQSWWECGLTGQNSTWHDSKTQTNSKQ